MTLSKFLKAKTEQVSGLISRSWDITDHENYWYRRGTTPYALVAHVDTLAPPKVSLYMDTLGFVRNRHGILGADDRNGCWIISELMRFNPHIFLFNYEESGGIGVRSFFMNHEIPKGINYFLEFDRKGMGEFVYYSDVPSRKLVRWAEMFGMTEEWGSFSDVSVMTDETNIPHLNLSAGFVSEHSKNERVHFPSMPKLVNRYKKMLEMAPKNVGKLPPKMKFYYQKPSWPRYDDMWLNYGSRSGSYNYIAS